MQLHSLFYVSRGRRDLVEAEVDAITTAAMRRNSRCGITGFLYYDCASFMQILEGLEDDLGTVFESIQNDARHNRIRMLDFRAIERRAFSGWALGLHTDGEDGFAAQYFGGALSERASRADVPELARFLRDLSIGREDDYALGGPDGR